MPSLPPIETADLWTGLQWTSGFLVPMKSLLQPLAVKGSPAEAGIYRMTWVGAEGWKLLTKSFKVSSSARVIDPFLTFEELTPPVPLTVGRTLNLRKRFRQHFGINPSNNRVWRRLQLIGSAVTPEELRELVAGSVVVDWAVVPSWIQRCLLERYGFAKLRPILDFEAEH